MTYKRYELFNTSFAPHSEAFAQPLRAQVVLLDIAVDAACPARCEQVVEKRRRSLAGEPHALEAGIEKPTHVVRVRRLPRGEYLADQGIALFQAHGIAQRASGGPHHAGNSLLHGSQPLVR